MKETMNSVVSNINVMHENENAVLRADAARPAMRAMPAMPAMSAAPLAQGQPIMSTERSMVSGVEPPTFA